jgi:hypothetical protein
MISIKINEIDINQRWLKNAENATKSAIREWEQWLKDGAKGKFEYKFNQQIWTIFKKWLLKYKFNNKCAYCETAAVQFYADAEHYRPKGNVKACDLGTGINTTKCLLHINSQKQSDIPHPGYFWLAYNWQNLIPACKSCNSGLDEQQGKVDQFPVSKLHVLATQLTAQQIAQLKDRYYKSVLWQDLYYLGPLDLNELEGPLILNPLNAIGEQDPRKHICFGKKGIEAGLTLEGRATIQICRLYNQQLRDLRQVAQERIHALYYGSFADPFSIVNSPIIKERIRKYINGVAPYSAAALDYLDILEKEHKKIWEDVRDQNVR